MDGDSSNPIGIDAVPLGLGNGAGMHSMTTEAALEEYEKYCQTHVATKADPLHTFSGWLRQFRIELTDAEI